MEVSNSMGKDSLSNQIYLISVMSFFCFFFVSRLSKNLLAKIQKDSIDNKLMLLDRKFVNKSNTMMNSTVSIINKKKSFEIIHWVHSLLLFAQKKMAIEMVVSHFNI